MEILMYGVEEPEHPDSCDPVYEEREYQEARKRAAECKGKVICFEFEYSDSYTVDDFTEEEADER